MKIFKPYLNLSKTTENYVLGVVLSASKDYSVEKIEQQEIDVLGIKYWGVIISVSMKTQVVNAPDIQVFSSEVAIDLDKSETYSKIKCVVQQVIPTGELGPAQDEESDVDFDDAT